jgi:hypothetical protein
MANSEKRRREQVGLVQLVLGAGAALLGAVFLARAWGDQGSREFFVWEGGGSPTRGGWDAYARDPQYKLPGAPNINMFLLVGRADTEADARAEGRQAITKLGLRPVEIPVPDDLAPEEP